MKNSKMLDDIASGIAPVIKGFVEKSLSQMADENFKMKEKISSLEKQNEEFQKNLIELLNGA